MLHSFLGLFQFMHAVGQGSLLHLFRFLRSEVVHQSSKFTAIVLAQIRIKKTLRANNPQSHKTVNLSKSFSILRQTHFLQAIP